MNIVILAAGMGKRMRSRLPKVLQPLANKPMLEHVIEKARLLGDQNRLIVVVGHGAEAVKAYFKDDKDLTFALQAEQLGTGHALLQALPFCDKNEPTLVLLGDVPLICPETLRKLVEASGDAMGLLTVKLDNPTGYGRIVREAGKVCSIVEEKDATEEQRSIKEVNTGIMVLPTRYLDKWLSELGNQNAQGEYYLTDVIARAVKEGVTVNTALALTPEEVEGVNNKVQLANLERAFQKANALRLMNEGVTVVDPSRIDVRGELICGQDVTIDVGCIFSGRVVLGGGVRIGAYCVLKDVEIGAGTEVLPFCHFDGAEVGRDARLGPYSRLRPGTTLADNTHIGNFVEIKKSVVGLGSKVNHLSYIGDTDMGARVNIGAGTITCNYDGVNKFRTTIMDDAFIGSDTQLVAPVTVGKGATLGAGTTLTKNAPDGELTIARARQMTIKGWKRPVKKL
ncbi:bifunctional UDP-N-acetylglucosamine diphosphorylase/glucosamine-1-phosphate N-acetyltransferase GlmU [Parasutterella secunda]|uniref:bifunctional UDP-N-acetylglucosamine diphosphorylase/glucosamine-1-phosphate N-acetyltransferase GlmU n=1 Tax=Parasutterella secunda TaxID=626947 RepID=UPI0025A39F3D|nr:bifunctional UDP-N-acetylglucosamine diphosphorylase/glucosamine-1-phosphate N-acetyltransferase GlmU [Parasutterella secunda]MDM8226951.1 bifunctional UDP-N-acetylglucosamine diphosphorylase/glucosamine-1-phosphate N-acetyltransferase GlmU [Parasutterella secunda]